MTKTLPEDIRLLMRSSVNRIRDIANNLVEPLKTLSKEFTLQQASESHVYLLSSIIDNIISEKRMQFRSLIGIEIEAQLGASSYGIFAEVNLVEFKRVLSNLINNAVEALRNEGNVSITLGHQNEHAMITIIDNGIGIPPHILPKLGKRGVSHDKANGSGLGLHHAKTSLQQWHGALSIHSKDGAGTAVQITLPLAKPPQWFVKQITLKPAQTVVIFDDDMSIHQIWHGKFQPLIETMGIELVSLSTPAQFREWMKHVHKPLSNVLFLVDHELLGFTESGLDLIQAFSIETSSILVTSHFEEIAIMERCEAQHIRMIPKATAPFVPVNLRLDTVFQHTFRFANAGKIGAMRRCRIIMVRCLTGKINLLVDGHRKNISI